MFEQYNHLGFMNPYYVSTNDKFVIKSEFKDVIQSLPGKREIDVATVIEIISRYYCFADRTLVQGIYRTPWMAKPDSTGTDWDFADCPSHGDKIMPVEEIAKELFARLQTEILAYIQGHSTIGILLSGGMDSRIVAAVLEYLLKTQQASSNVVAMTWGMETSRDVIYAEQIVHRLGWDWVHYPINAEVLLNNITETAKRGCEYSPVHLHAMPHLRDIEGIDCILAASFGDSVGRAEYSGTHLSELTPFEHHTLNWFKLLRIGAYKEGTAHIEQDIGHYHLIFPREKQYQQHEIDQQAHYLRRKLNPCMAIINERVPLLQVFTHPKVFGFMWSLDASVRNDLIYKHLLNLFITDLSDIPWARTGRPYLSQGQAIDDYPDPHHRYGTWIRGELYDSIRKKVLSDNISRLNVFNMPALASALEINRKIARQVRATKMDEISIWLASLADFVELYDIQGTRHSSEYTLFDYINGRIIAPLQVIGLVTTKFILSRK